MFSRVYLTTNAHFSRLLHVTQILRLPLVTCLRALSGRVFHVFPRLLLAIFPVLFASGSDWLMRYV